MESPSRKKQRFSETVSDLLDAGLQVPGDELRPARKALREVRATLRPDGRLELNGEVHGSLSASATAVTGLLPHWRWETEARY